MHYLPFGARLNKGILMVTQLILGFSAYLNQRELLPLVPCKSILNTFVYEIYQRVSILFELSVKHTLSDFLLPYRCRK